MRTKREIEERPLLPNNFSNDFIEPLTKLCFKKDTQNYLLVDAIFIFGTFFSANEVKVPLEDILNQCTPHTLFSRVAWTIMMILYLNLNLNLRLYMKS